MPLTDLHVLRAYFGQLTRKNIFQSVSMIQYEKTIKPSGRAEWR
jgi:hypothetical protein